MIFDAVFDEDFTSEVDESAIELGATEIDGEHAEGVLVKLDQLTFAPDRGMGGLIGAERKDEIFFDEAIENAHDGGKADLKGLSDFGA